MTPFEKYHTILFDLDGTLTDPKPGITQCVQYALASFGIEEPCLDHLEKFIGPPLKDSFKEFYGFSDNQAQTALEKYRERFAEKGLYENSVYPLIPELLDALSAAGKNLAVATSKPTVFAAQILEHFRLSSYFTLVAGSNLDGSRVIKGEVIRYALEELKLTDYDSIVMIGDRKHDAIGAKENGIDSIGVLYGYGSEEEFQTVGPTHIVETVSALHRFLLG